MFQTLIFNCLWRREMTRRRQRFYVSFTDVCDYEAAHPSINQSTDKAQWPSSSSSTGPRAREPPPPTSPKGDPGWQKLWLEDLVSEDDCSEDGTPPPYGTAPPDGGKPVLL